MPVPKFSKFLHGAALLFQAACHNVPYWFLPGGWAQRLTLLSRYTPRYTETATAAVKWGA
jgi:hypothetical protein